MKKMFNKKFFLIFGSTITLLIVLSIAMIFLTKENVKTFSKEGYIIASGNKETSTKYYFDEGTSYKTNISSQIVFTDTSGEKVKIETDNFMHYIDGGIKFLKNGVIMDLDSVNASTVPYYNITNKSLLEYSKKSYFIETVDKTLAFNNLAGRISENKYIFAGVNIKLQLAGNEKIIEGDYFEVNFIEDGIIKVENQEVSYQTTAENSYILVNDSIKIDLGNKKIYYNDEEMMSLTQMTIDGNENIEIVTEEEEDDDSGNGTGEGDGTGEGTGNGQGDGGSGNDGNVNTPGGDGGQTDGTGSQPGDGNNDGTGDGTGNGNSTKRNASIELVNASVGVNNISANFILNDPDKTITGDLVIHITNTDTGKRVYSDRVFKNGEMIGKTQVEFNFGISSLSPDSNYILSINEESNKEYDTQYFQKLFKTESLGITLEKEYATQDSLAYKVVFGEDTQVKTAKITLCDEKYNPVSEPVLVYPNNNIAYFENLTNNTTYNVVLDDVIMDNMEYNKVYSIYKTATTLKKTPYLEGLTTSVDDETNVFTIGVDRIVDEDESIYRYTYYIYKADDITLDTIDNLKPVKKIISNNDGKVKVGIDNENILPKTNYRFKVVAEYYDNEKNGEFETILSDNFILSGKPTIKFVQNEEESTFNRIVGTILLNDENCTVPFAGRNCSTNKFYNNTFILEYEDATTSKTMRKNINFNATTLEAVVDVSDLTADTLYEFNLFGDVDLLDGIGIRKEYLLGSFIVRTDGVDALVVKPWAQNQSTRQDVVNVSAKITSTGDDESIGDSINNITFNLYAGDVSGSLNSGIAPLPIASKKVSGDLKEEYYDRIFTINTLDTFGIVTQKEESYIDEETGEKVIIKPYLSAIDVFKNLTGGTLLNNYTIEITGISDYANNEIPIDNNYFVFSTPALLLMEEQMETPTIVADPIENGTLNEDKTLAEKYNISYNKKLSGSTIVGYNLNATANVNRIVAVGGIELIYYACDEKMINCDLDNSVMSQSVDLTQTTNLELAIPVDLGTKYTSSDKGKLARGHNYVFKLKFGIDTDGDGLVDTYYPSTDVKTGIKRTPKQTPSYKSYIVNTTDSIANYKFEYYDIDNALYEEVIYYTIDNELKNKVDTPSEDEDSGTDDDVTVIDETVPDDGDEGTEEEDSIKSVNLSDCKSITNTSNYTKGYLCDFVVDSLSTDSVYNLSFKRALIKYSSGIENVNIGDFIFDGKFAYDKNTVTFSNITYENDNVLRIKINETNDNIDYINRISAYHIVLSADGEDDYERIYPSDKVNTCVDGDSSYKCIEVDYADIKNFKTKNITVKVVAYYDSGIIDNVFATSNSDISSALTNKIGYILQNNNYYDKSFKRARYIAIRENGSVTTSEYPSGIYEFKKAASTSIDIIRKIDLTNYVFAEQPSEYNLTLFYSNDGIYTKDSSKINQSVNNKLLSTVDLGTNKGTFKFNSIIPKISVTSKGLVNGARVTINANGVDNDILKNEFKSEDGKYYYYLDIYKDEEKTEVYKTAKVEIDLENGTVLELTKYMPDTTYYFEVSAYLLKESEYKKTLLFDSKNSSKYVSALYSFSSLAPTGIYPSRGTPKASYTSTSNTTDNIYLTRTLTLEMLPNTNIGNYTTRFELYDINTNKVLEETVELVKQSDGSIKAKVVKDITPTENEMAANGVGGYVFGEGYYTMKVYIITDVYESEEAPNGKAELLVYDQPITLTPLVEPVYNVKRVKQNGAVDYGTNDLKFTVTIQDTNKVIKKGEYCAVLLDFLEQPISGISPQCGLSAMELGKEISYSGLTSDTIYIFKVYADVYTNNVNIDAVNKNRVIYSNTVVTTNTNHGVALGQVTAYGSSSKVTLSFDSGINILDIKKVEYTLYEKSSSESGSVNKALQIYIMGGTNSGQEELGDGSEISKTFKTDGNNVELEIKPTGLSLTKGYLYTVAVKYYIKQNNNYVLIKEDSYGVKY